MYPVQCSRRLGLCALCLWLNLVGICSRSKQSKQVTKSSLGSLFAIAGSNAGRLDSVQYRRASGDIRVQAVLSISCGYEICAETDVELHVSGYAFPLLPMLQTR